MARVKNKADYDRKQRKKSEAAIKVASSRRQEFLTIDQNIPSVTVDVMWGIFDVSEHLNGKRVGPPYIDHDTAKSEAHKWCKKDKKGDIKFVLVRLSKDKFGSRKASEAEIQDQYNIRHGIKTGSVNLGVGMAEGKGKGIKP